MNNNKFVFTHDQEFLISEKLIGPIMLFREGLEKYRAQLTIRDFVIGYCFDNGLPLADTVEKVNELSKGKTNLKMEEIIPESKKGQESLIRYSLFHILRERHSIFDDQKRDENLGKLCELTGVSKEMAEPIINTALKQEKRRIIETELESFLMQRVITIKNPKDRKNVRNEVIEAFAGMLAVTPKYIKQVLYDKEKRDIAEANRVLAFREKKAKEEQERLRGATAKPNGDSTLTNSGGVNLDDDDNDAR